LLLFFIRGVPVKGLKEVIFKTKSTKQTALLIPGNFLSTTQHIIVLICIDYLKENIGKNLT